MIQTTTWRPDTCDCELHYSWDDSVPAEERVHKPESVVITSSGQTLPTVECQHHVGMVDIEDHHNVVQEENTRKNNIAKHLVETYPELSEVDSGGNMRLRANTFLWSFDSERKLVTSVEGLSDIKKAELQGEVDSKHGVGKVVIS